MPAFEGGSRREWTCSSSYEASETLLAEWV